MIAIATDRWFATNAGTRFTLNMILKQLQIIYLLLYFILLLILKQNVQKEISANKEIFLEALFIGFALHFWHVLIQ